MQLEGYYQYTVKRVSICNHLEKEEKAGCVTIIVLQMYCYCKCSVALPRGAVGWSAACDCGISGSYSLTFCIVASTKFTSFYHMTSRLRVK